MKLTWFGGTTLRIYIGGQILVADAPPDAGEIISGADRLFQMSDELPPLITGGRVSSDDWWTNRTPSR